MPSYDNAKKLADQIVMCETNLDSLFEGLKKSYDLEQQLAKIKAYYRRAFNKTHFECAGEDIVEEYQNLVFAIEQLKSGKLTADEALETIEETANNRTAGVIVYNLFKMCELLFWAAAAAACYVGCISVGIPLICCEPVIGLAITIGTGALLLNTANECLNCFEQFQSLDPIEEETIREKNIVSFFAPATSLQSTTKFKEEDSSCFSAALGS